MVFLKVSLDGMMKERWNGMKFGWMATLESCEVREKIGYASRFVRVILAQGPC